MDLSKYADMVERAGWTGVEAALAYVLVSIADIPAWWTAPLAATLTVAKVMVSNRIKARADG